jgi:neutral amino acid transport system permease protein
VLDQLANGILLGAVIAMTSVGLSLIFSVTGSFNFAHGDLVTLGAMMTVLFATALSVPVWLAIILAVAAGALIGLILDRAMFRPMRRAGVGGITTLVATLGLSLIARYAILAVGGPEPKALPIPAQRVTSFFGLGFTPMALVVIISTIVILVGFGLFLTKSTLGTAMRAVASNKTLAAASGINIERIISVTWVIGGALAAVGGVMLALTQLVYWDMGFQLLLLMFAGVIVGGLGSPFGAIVGGFVIGLITQLSVTLPYIKDHNDLKIAVALLVMVIVLFLRPQGLLGRRARLS